MKGIHLFFASLFISLSPAFGQDIDLSGYWYGSVTVPLAADLHGEYYFTQEGKIVEGWSRTVSANGTDSMMVKLAGSLNGKVMTYRNTEFVYKSIQNCLAIGTLKYVVEDGQQKLVGNWKGNFELTTCPPGVGGKVELVKVPDKKPTTLGISRSSENKSAVQEETREASEYIISSRDYEGQGLTEELQYRKYYALIIGVDDYNDEQITDLDNPVNDAQQLKSVLNDKYNFKEENTIFLSNPTRPEIIEAFDELSVKIEKRDQLLIFYAGHGIWDERLEQGYWLPSDASKISKAQWLSNSTIRDYIGGIKSQHTLLITDACFSGSIFKERGVAFENSKAMLEMYKLPSRKAITSGTLKTVPDRSVFIKYLLKNLDQNDKPLLSAGELFNTFKIAVINNSINGQVPQYGAIGQAGDEGGDFIFIRVGE